MAIVDIKLYKDCLQSIFVEFFATLGSYRIKTTNKNTQIDEKR